jgi:transglutaminase-like putative cysteine protease
MNTSYIRAIWIAIVVFSLALLFAQIAGGDEGDNSAANVGGAKTGVRAATSQPANAGFERGAVGHPPADWLVPKIAGYNVLASDERPAEGRQCGSIVSTDDSQRGPFGNLMQLVDAKPFQGKRVRLRAAVRAEVSGKGNQAQMWFRVDRPEKDGVRQAGAFDNMMRRPITSDQWNYYDIVGDVDYDARTIAVGVFLAGEGKAWIDDVSLEVVSDDVTVTAWRIGRGASSLDAAKPGLFEVVSSARLTSSPVAPPEFIGFPLFGVPIAPQTILMPLPLAYRDQAPLGFHLTVEPPDAVKSTEIYRDVGDNYVLKLVIEDLRKWKKVDVTYTSTVLVGPSDFGDVPTTALLPDAWPDEARPWLAATWCADAEHERIRAIAEEILKGTDDIREIIRRVQKKSQQIFLAASGQVDNLTAVEALDKQGSCTSCANLVAALLRASGVPARVIAGYPSWSGPLQTHYIVEAYVPGSGWYPMEATLGRSPWPNMQQINVAIIPTDYESESKAGVRSEAAGGVPYLSVTEMPDNAGDVMALGLVDRKRNCDHLGKMIRPLEGTQGQWAEALALATTRWQAWLSGDHKMDADGVLKYGKLHDDLKAASVEALIAELERQSAD